jgi:hypothetical protein
MGGRLGADGAMSNVESGTAPLVLIVHIIGIMCTTQNVCHVASALPETNERHCGIIG